ncbi:MAG: nickel-dependent lactate racemase [Anaerolineaceae bacterium]|nr:nickel-dependent lactate racemase [Anaerolineaceae bacterium]
MRVRLAYGKQGLPLELPDDHNVRVIENRFVPALADPEAALRSALRAPIDTRPLRELANEDNTVAIVFSDITRPTPNHLILPAILEELAHLPDDNILLCNALGTHRPNSRVELEQMLGADIVARYRIVQNDAVNGDTQVCIGRSSFGHELWINRDYLEADVKILTGFIEPHFFAGFSGGGKAVMPGMAGQRTVFGNHDAGMIADERATWGITHGNPIWEEAREAALLTRPDLLLNVSLNSDKEITGVFAGELASAHDAGIDFVRASSMVAVEQPCDIVITTNSGWPLDMNLYQAVKGMSAAEQIVKPGGSIIIAAECAEGVPEHGLYGQLLNEATNATELASNVLKAQETRQDQWQAQIQARIQARADVYVYADGLSDSQIENALLLPCRDIPALLDQLLRRYGSDARIAILPEGPQTIPWLKESMVQEPAIA